MAPPDPRLLRAAERRVKVHGLRAATRHREYWTADVQLRAPGGEVKALGELLWRGVYSRRFMVGVRDDASFYVHVGASGSKIRFRLPLDLLDAALDPPTTSAP